MNYDGFGFVMIMRYTSYDRRADESSSCNFGNYSVTAQMYILLQPMYILDLSSSSQGLPQVYLFLWSNFLNPLMASD